MARKQTSAMPGLVVKFHRVGASSWWTLPWTNIQFNESTSPGYGAFTCAFKSPTANEFAPITKRADPHGYDSYYGPWPVPGDWYTIETNFQTIAFGRVMSPAVRVENQPSGATTAQLTVSGVSWFDYIRQLPIYVNWLGATVTNAAEASQFVSSQDLSSTPWSSDEAAVARLSTNGIPPSSYMPLDTFVRLASTILTQGSRGSVGAALQTYIDAVSDMTLPESLGGGSLRDHIVVVHDATTARQHAPGWVKEGITNHGMLLTNIGGNFFEANIGSIIDSTFAIDPAWVDLFPMLHPMTINGPENYTEEQGWSTSLWKALNARLVLVYRTKPFRYRPLSKDIVGGSDVTIANVFENKTFDVQEIQAARRVIPAEYIRSDFDYKKSLGDMVNLGVVHPNGFGASDPNALQQAFGLPLIKADSIRQHGVFRSTIKWPFIPDDKAPGDLPEFMRALAANLMQIHGNGDKYRSGNLQVPFIFTQKGNPWVERERTRQLIPLHPGQHFGFSQTRDGRIMYAYCTSMTHSVMRNPNGAMHSATGITFVRGMYEDEVEDIASCKVDMSTVPVAVPAKSRKKSVAEPLALDGFVYRGATYPLLAQNGTASGRKVQYSQLYFPVSGTGTLRDRGSISSIVLHSSTSGPTMTPKRLISTFQTSLNSGVKPRCTNFLIGAQGDVWQDLDAAVASYHVSDGSDTINNMSVGIELVHPVSPAQSPSGWLRSTTTAGAIRLALPFGAYDMPAAVPDTAEVTVIDMRGDTYTDALTVYPLYRKFTYREVITSRGIRRLLYHNFLTYTNAQLLALGDLLRGLFPVLKIPVRTGIKTDGVVRGYTDIGAAKALAAEGGLFTHFEVYPGHVDVLGLNPEHLLRSL